MKKVITMWYVNNRNEHKYMIVKKYACRHTSMKQCIIFDYQAIMNFTGDGCFHRFRKSTVIDILSDYTLVFSE